MVGGRNEEPLVLRRPRDRSKLDKGRTGDRNIVSFEFLVRDTKYETGTRELSFGSFTSISLSVNSYTQDE